MELAKGKRPIKGAKGRGAGGGRGKGSGKARSARTKPAAASSSGRSMERTAATATAAKAQRRAASGRAGKTAKRRAASGRAGKTAKRRAAAARRPIQRHTTGHGKRAAVSLKAEIKEYYDAGGFLSWSAAAKKFVVLGTNEPKGGLVACPECGLGQLMVVRSKATRKRFIGCSNYYSGCGASSPLLQRARLRALKQPCRTCSWPMVIFRYSKNQKWTRQCSNVRCPTRNPPAQS